jgi:hypothetical protein
MNDKDKVDEVFARIKEMSFNNSEGFLYNLFHKSVFKEEDTLHLLRSYIRTANLTGKIDENKLKVCKNVKGVMNLFSENTEFGLKDAKELVDSVIKS